METNLYVDVQLIQDGTARWLWRLLGDNVLRGAGVAMSVTDAERAGHDALAALEDRDQARKAHGTGLVWQTTHLDLDELERRRKEQ